MHGPGETSSGMSGMSSEGGERIRPWNIAVLAGGKSAEREVSLRSGAAVAAALRDGGHRVVELDPARDNIEAIDWQRVSFGRPGDAFAVDCIFIALHGSYGEDGTVQAILEAQGVPYTGSAAEPSRIAFSKWAAKQKFLQAGLPTPPATRLRLDDPAGFASSAANTIGYPVVVKPDRQGSSIGVTIVRSPTELDAALAACFRFDCEGLIEAAVLGDEWTVALIDGEALPPIRIGTVRQFYDYTAKYAAEDTTYEFETAPLPVTRELGELARAAYSAVGASGIARVDLRMDAGGRPFLLEVNTIPGMTDHSLVPKAAARVGLSMTALCERAISSALASHHARNNSRVQTAPSSTLFHRRAG
jgi:D-alanine-D-alanine ligase